MLRVITPFLLLMGLFFFSGCAMWMQTPKTTAAKTPLTPQEKRTIYQNVLNEIEHHSTKGDEYYKEGYYYEAARSYELVNFYEDRAVIPAKKIREITEKAHENGEFFYKKGFELYTKDKTQALRQLNMMMRNNPHHPEGKPLYLKLKKEPEIIAFLQAKEQAVQNVLQKDSDIKKINAVLTDLLAYSDDSSVAIEAKKALENKYTQSLEEAVTLYNKQAYLQAATKFKLIRVVYTNDPTATKYLARIDEKYAIEKLVKDAQKELSANAYEKAIALAEKALDKESDHEEARSVLAKAKALQKAQMPQLIEEAKALYLRQDFEHAKALFQSVLRYDPDDNTSLTYIKKIEQQLKTLESLR
ncbi:MAG: hypothetical protein KU37_03840 [Sulfuricurvum sp. PC08-66]|nr:MAG: hypothetical protein KU37_03840 [Sulfuricurvum sp. PC08-66]